jgi:hypothetical protein
VKREASWNPIFFLASDEIRITFHAPRSEGAGSGHMNGPLFSGLVPVDRRSVKILSSLFSVNCS